MEQKDGVVSNDSFRTERHRCVICGSEAIMSLSVEGRKNNACIDHLAQAEQLLRVSEEYFRGPSF